MRKRFADGDIAMTEMARSYGVDKRTVSLIIRGETWKHVGGPTFTDGRPRRPAMSKLNRATADAIRAAAASGEKQYAIGRRLGISDATVSRVVNWHSWAS